MGAGYAGPGACAPPERGSRRGGPGGLTCPQEAGSTSNGSRPRPSGQGDSGELGWTRSSAIVVPMLDTSSFRGRRGGCSAYQWRTPSPAAPCGVPRRVERSRSPPEAEVARDDRRGARHRLEQHEAEALPAQGRRGEDGGRPRELAPARLAVPRDDERGRHGAHRRAQHRQALARHVLPDAGDDRPSCHPEDSL
jgi:hypothetical protein